MWRLSYARKLSRLSLINSNDLVSLESLGKGMDCLSVAGVLSATCIDGVCEARESNFFFTNARKVLVLTAFLDQ